MLPLLTVVITSGKQILSATFSACEEVIRILMSDTQHGERWESH